MNLKASQGKPFKRIDVITVVIRRVSIYETVSSHQTLKGLAELIYN